MTGTVLDGSTTKENYTHLSAHGVASLGGRRWTQTDAVVKKSTHSIMAVTVGPGPGLGSWLCHLPTVSYLISVCVRALICKI